MGHPFVGVAAPASFSISSLKHQARMSKQTSLWASSMHKSQQQLLLAAESASYAKLDFMLFLRKRSLLQCTTNLSHVRDRKTLTYHSPQWEKLTEVSSKRPPG